MLSLDGFFFGPLLLMQYTKPPLTFEQQADLLIRRGMTGDRDLIVSRLAAVNYYRLSGYWHPFKDSNEDFVPGTSFDEVWTRYVFDRRLRLLLIDAIERTEVAVRCRLAYEHAHRHGPFAYADDPATLPKLDAHQHADFLTHVGDETSRSKEAFVAHFRSQYGDCHPYLPVWEATEVMTMGTLLTFFKGSPHRIKKAVASCFNMPDEMISSWLLTLNAIRNICAHHGRLWNRTLGVKPWIPRAAQYPDWHSPVQVGNDKVFGVLTVCRYCLRRVAPQSGWPQRFTALIDEFPSIPLADMGFPTNWKDSPLWK